MSTLQLRFLHLILMTMIPRLLPSNKVPHLGCCRWLPSSNWQDFHIPLLWMIPWLLTSNRAKFPHLVSAVNDCYHRIEQDFHIPLLWMIPWLLSSNEAKFPHLVFALCSIESRFPHLIFAVNDSLMATITSSKVPTSGIAVKDFSQIATLESSKVSISGLCCEWFPDYYLG